MIDSTAGTCVAGLAGKRALALSLIGAGLTAACAQISFYLPGNPVPVTLQVFAVVLCGMALGSRYGLLSQLTYLAAGAAGLPIFAGFKGGVLTLAGPTGGYLVGFCAAAFLVGWVTEHIRPSYVTRVLAGLSGVVVVYLFGRLWLDLWMASADPLTSWALGVAPFAAIDVIKVTAAAAVCPRR